jgi:hypothetical protein
VPAGWTGSAVSGTLPIPGGPRVVLIRLPSPQDAGPPLPDIRTASIPRRPHDFVRGPLAAVLAIPVIGLVIVESLARRLSPRRPAFLVLYLLVATVTLSAAGTVPIGAGSPASPAPIAAGEFKRVPIADPTPAATEAPRAAVTRPADRFPMAAPAVVPPPEAPAVVRFRPRDGWAGVSRFAQVSVRFSGPMDRISTEEAFHVFVGDAPVKGTARWAEGDTVLVVDPASVLPYGARVRLSVDLGARSAGGVPLEQARSVTFSVQVRPVPAAHPAPTSRPAPPSTAWRWPLIGPITQRFGESLTKYGFHQGIDIDGDTGDPVRAARAGRVVVAGYWDECGGLQIHIDHGDGFSSWYRHLSRVDVSKGSRVSAGAVIGRVGNTGCSLGSHLLFGIRRGTTFVDPLRYLPPR